MEWRPGASFWQGTQSTPSVARPYDVSYRPHQHPHHCPLHIHHFLEFLVELLLCFLQFLPFFFGEPALGHQVAVSFCFPLLQFLFGNVDRDKKVDRFRGILEQGEGDCDPFIPYNHLPSQGGLVRKVCLKMNK